MSEIDKIGIIHTDFPSKFGIPRQSGLVEALKGQISFCPKYRNPDAFRGLEGFSHIWLIWEFSQNKREGWSASVKPPRLGGKKKMGVFATRSPFRPNPLGLSCVKLERIEYTKEHGPILHVSGADLMDGTPIYDIKPYLPYADSFPDANAGFAKETYNHSLKVEWKEELRERIPVEKREALIAVLAQDPRPPYHSNPQQVYKVAFDKVDVHFTVEEDQLTVNKIVPL